MAETEGVGAAAAPHSSKTAIHNFIDTSERVAPDNLRFHGQLAHVRDMVEQPVLRRVLDIPPDGEVTLDRKDIDRGYAQFSAPMY